MRNPHSATMADQRETSDRHRLAHIETQEEGNQEMR